MTEESIRKLAAELHEILPAPSETTKFVPDRGESEAAASIASGAPPHERRELTSAATSDDTKPCRDEPLTRHFA